MQIVDTISVAQFWGEDNRECLKQKNYCNIIALCAHFSQFAIRLDLDQAEVKSETG